MEIITNALTALKLDEVNITVNNAADELSASIEPNVLHIIDCKMQSLTDDVNMQLKTC